MFHNVKKFLIGNDNVQDYWSTFGTGNMLQKANLISELYGLKTEYDLSRNLGFATKNITPLDNKGNQQWPKTGDNADIVLIDASCKDSKFDGMQIYFEDGIYEVSEMIYNSHINVFCETKSFKIALKYFFKGNKQKIRKVIQTN